MEGLEVDQFARGDIKEGQSASMPVQVYPCSAGSSCMDGSSFVTMLARVTTIRAHQGPGLIIASKTAVIPFPLPLDSFVRHS